MGIIDPGNMRFNFLYKNDANRKLLAVTDLKKESHNRECHEMGYDRQLIRQIDH